MRARAAALFAAVALVIASCNGEFRFDEMVDGSPGVPEASVESSPPPPTSCKSDADCKLSTLHCDTVSGACVPCLIDAHCTMTGFPRCDAALHRCVQCGVTGDCPSGQVCQVEARTCVTSCNNLAGCIMVAAPLCDLNRGFCIRCLMDLECFQDNMKVCDTSDGQCVACLQDSQCSGAKPRCDRYAGTCVACLTGADCPPAKPLCDPSTGTCTAG
jgi:hypothetical protein